MRHYAILNNYQIGSGEFRCTATDKVVEKTRIDRYHTKVVWENLEENEKEHIIGILLGRKAYKLKEV